jgi:hypothetical protein
MTSAELCDGLRKAVAAEMGCSDRRLFPHEVEAIQRRATVLFHDAYDEAVQERLRDYAARAARSVDAA